MKKKEKELAWDTEMAKEITYSLMSKTATNTLLLAFIESPNFKLQVIDKLKLIKESGQKENAAIANVILESLSLRMSDHRLLKEYARSMDFYREIIAPLKRMAKWGQEDRQKIILQKNDAEKIISAEKSLSKKRVVIGSILFGAVATIGGYLIHKTISNGDDDKK
ncbi:MAG: hypothetical protein QMD50_02070 [Patescibacteria group bacterium]|nr:hypothetical protein [Patescibacteria group bacterium]